MLLFVCLSCNKLIVRICTLPWSEIPVGSKSFSTPHLYFLLNYSFEQKKGILRRISVEMERNEELCGCFRSPKMSSIQAELKTCIVCISNFKNISGI